jgi:hypothetical protein
LLGLPSAGGYPPVWQVAQAFVTVAWVWFHKEGDHPVAVAAWHVMQFAVVGIWLVDLPGAVEPLWHVLQLVAVVYTLWSGLLEAHDEVDLWQLSQTVTPLCTAVLGFCVAPSPLLDK